MSLPANATPLSAAGVLPDRRETIVTNISTYSQPKVIGKNVDQTPIKKLEPKGIQNSALRRRLVPRESQQSFDLQVPALFGGRSPLSKRESEQALNLGPPQQSAQPNLYDKVQGQLAKRRSSMQFDANLGLNN